MLQAKNGDLTPCLVRGLQRLIGPVHAFHRVGIGHVGRAFHDHHDDGANSYGQHRRPVQNQHTDGLNVHGGDERDDFIIGRARPP